MGLLCGRDTTVHSRCMNAWESRQHTRQLLFLHLQRKSMPTTAFEVKGFWLRAEDAMDDLYREVIIEHYKNPSYRGKLDPHDISFADDNPLCGDHIQIDLRVADDGKITEARFDGHGCAISQASADLLIESIIGKSLDMLRP
jgi:hypothetical protein